VKAWNESLSLDTSTLQSLPIWVQFPELDIKYWGVESISKLGSMLGIPIKMDRTTKEKTAIRYARVLIEMPLEGSFLKYIDFVNDWEVVARQKVHYEWKPILCSQCKMLGHEEQVCRKKNKVRQEWRPIDRDRDEDKEEEYNTQGGGNQGLRIQEDQEGFVRPRKSAPRVSQQQLVERQSPVINPFLALRKMKLV